jgi:hypothetical protein
MPNEERRVLPKTNKSAGGIGHSKQFNAPVGSFEDLPEFRVAGVPLSDHPMKHAIPARFTDEGMAAHDEKPKAFTQVLSDSFDKKLHQRKDFLKTEMEPWEAPDARKELADQHLPAGHVGRFLSDTVVTQHGMRGWKPVITADGSTVKLGNMTLGSMPKDVAERRNKAMQRRSKDAIDTIYNHQVEQLTKDTRDAGMRMADGEDGFVRTQESTLG